MAKECIVCGKVKGKRTCLPDEDQLICPKCCVKIRGRDCAGCRYYFRSEQYHSGKREVTRVKNYIIELNPEIDDAVDKALALVEKGRLTEGERDISRLYQQYPSYSYGVVRYGCCAIIQRRIHKSDFLF